MGKLGTVNTTNPKQDEHVWVPDPIEGFVLGVVIRVSSEIQLLLSNLFSMVKLTALTL